MAIMKRINIIYDLIKTIFKLMVLHNHDLAAVNHEKSQNLLTICLQWSRLSLPVITIVCLVLSFITFWLFLQPNVLSSLPPYLE